MSKTSGKQPGGRGKRAGARPLLKLDQRLRLGDEGLRVSPICVGLVKDRRVISAAFAAGINFFFVTADMHWMLYEETRQGLRELLRSVARDDVVVAAVTYVAPPEFSVAPVRELLDALPELEGRIDVYVIGGVYMPDLLPRLAVVQRRRDEKFCGMRAIAASFHDRGAAAFAAPRELVDLGFVRYNASHPRARDDLFPHLRASDSSTLIYNFTNIPGGVVDDATWARLRLRGYWRPRPTDFYRFALTGTPIDGLLCAMERPAHVAELADALARGPLDEEEQRYLINLCAVAKGRVELQRRRSRR
jgi:hypothetical protein